MSTKDVAKRHASKKRYLERKKVEEAEVAARLRRVAKTLPAFAPARRAGGAS